MIRAIVVVSSLALLAGCAARGRTGSDATALLSSDLRNLMSMQEVHYAEAYTYSSDLQRLEFVPSEGVTVRVTAATEGGHAALATSNDGVGCAVYVGDAEPPVTPGGTRPTEEGRIVCD